MPGRLARSIGAALLAAFLFAPTARAEDVVVFAAASLQNALDSVAAAWHEETGKTAAISYAASSALARQIDAGAPADVFFSADIAWMDYLEERDLIDLQSRASLLGNSIVLIAAAKDAPTVEIAPGFDLAGLLGDGRLAMADTEAVPAGRYGRASLETLGVWESVKDRTAEAENVRAALALVARGEAPYGIVYATDAHAEPGVKVVGTFPTDSHPPILYPAARVRASKNPDAADFVAYLASPEARPLFEAEGFTVLH